MPNKRTMQPTTMYAMPRNGFLLPKSDVVEMMIRLLPAKDFTG